MPSLPLDHQTPCKGLFSVLWGSGWSPRPTLALGQVSLWDEGPGAWVSLLHGRLHFQLIPLIQGSALGCVSSPPLCTNRCLQRMVLHPFPGEIAVSVTSKYPDTWISVFPSKYLHEKLQELFLYVLLCFGLFLFVFCSGLDLGYFLARANSENIFERNAQGKPPNHWFYTSRISVSWRNA